MRGRIVRQDEKQLIGALTAHAQLMTDPVVVSQATAIADEISLWISKMLCAVSCRS